MMWAIHNDKRIAMSMLHKCGSTSFKSSPDKFNLFVSNEQVLDIPIRVAWIRNPIDRLVSAYFNFHYLIGINFKLRFVFTEKEVESWPNFVDYILKHDDPHWNPQVPSLTYQTKYLPTHTEKFENISLNFNKYIPGTLIKTNIKPKTTLDLTYRNEEILNKYREDYLILNSGI